MQQIGMRSVPSHVFDFEEWHRLQFPYALIEALWGAIACADIDAYFFFYFFASLQFAIHAAVLH